MENIIKDILSKRERRCPGFVIPTLRYRYSEYCRDGPRKGLEFDESTFNMRTTTCDHTRCQPFAEYEWALIMAFLQGKIEISMWAESGPSTIVYPVIHC